MERYFSKERIKKAYNDACELMDSRGKKDGYEFQPKFNDCVAFVCAYDTALRGKHSPLVKEFANLEWSSSIECLRSMRAAGKTITQVMTENGYEKVEDKVPQTGDYGYYKGMSMICYKTHWMTCSDNGVNAGTRKRKVETRLRHIYRPIQE